MGKMFIDVLACNMRHSLLNLHNGWVWIIKQNLQYLIIMIVSYVSTHLRVESVVVVAVADRALNSFIAIKLSISYRCALFATGIDFWLTKLLYINHSGIFLVNAFLSRLNSSDLWSHVVY